MSNWNPIRDLKPGEELLAGGYDWAWCFVWFKAIPGYDGYIAGTNGTLWSQWKKTRKTGNRGTVAVKTDDFKKLTPWQDKISHYFRMRVKTDNGHRTIESVHKLILIAFSRSPKNGEQCCHGNGNRVDNSTRNLRWDTPAGNHKDRVAHGTVRCGTALNTSTFVDSDVSTIRLLSSSGLSQVEIAKRYKVNPTTINRMVRRKTWRHIL